MRRSNKPYQPRQNVGPNLGKTVTSRAKRAVKAIADASIVGAPRSQASQRFRQEDIATILMQSEPIRRERPVKFNRRPKQHRQVKVGRVTLARANLGSPLIPSRRYPNKPPSTLTTLIVILTALMIGVGAASHFSEVAAKRVKNIVSMVEHSQAVERGKRALRLESSNKQTSAANPNVTRQQRR